MQITIDPEFQGLIPKLQPSEYQQLEANLSADGCRDPLVLWGNVLVDGHNRYEICKRLGLPFDTVQMEFRSRDEALLWIVRNQLGRRNLTKEERAILIGEKYLLLKKPHGGMRGNQHTVASGQIVHLPTTAEEIASEFGESERTIRRYADFALAVKGIGETLGTEASNAIKSGELRATNEQVQVLAKVAQENPEQARVVMDMVRSDHKLTVDTAWQAVKKERRISDNRNERVKEIQQAQDIDQLGIYPVIYADPPWRYEHSISDSRAIENQYPTMSLDDICNLPIAQHATPNAILFLWATSPKLEEAMQVICAWGFTYRTCAVWVKDKLGMGYYFRQQHELLLVATKGSMLPPKPSDRLSSVIEANYEGHSHKPDKVYEIIESMYPEFEKLELFARNTREGWQVWGNEAHE